MHMAMYHQDVTFRGVPKSIDRLRHIVDVYLDDKRLKDNQLATRPGQGPPKIRTIKTADDGQPSQRASAAAPPKPKPKSQAGICYKWRDTGKCSVGDSCPFQPPTLRRIKILDLLEGQREEDEKEIGTARVVVLLTVLLEEIPQLAVALLAAVKEGLALAPLAKTKTKIKIARGLRKEKGEVTRGSLACAS